MRVQWKPTWRGNEQLQEEPAKLAIQPKVSQKRPGDNVLPVLIICEDRLAADYHDCPNYVQPMVVDVYMALDNDVVMTMITLGVVVLAALALDSVVAHTCSVLHTGPFLWVLWAYWPVLCYQAWRKATTVARFEQRDFMRLNPASEVSP